MAPPSVPTAMHPPSSFSGKHLIPRAAPALGASIDQVLETAQAHLIPEALHRDVTTSEDKTDHQQHPSSPSLSAPMDRPELSRHPSRIGLKHVAPPVTPGVKAVKVPVTIEYGSPALKPPVYIFTDLSDPSWEPVEMDALQDEHGACRFKKDFQVEPGEYQYKFRLGPGEWWALDSTKPTIDDGLGNKNNSIQVQEIAHTVAATPPVNGHEQPPNVLRSEDNAQAPLAKQETHEIQQSSEVVGPDKVSKLPEHESTMSTSVPAELSDKCSGAPLMQHEACLPKQPAKGLNLEIPEGIDTSSKRVPAEVTPLMNHEISSSTPPSSTSVDTAVQPDLDENYDGDDDSDDEGPPLLSHECLSSSSSDHTHSPISRHQSNSSLHQSNPFSHFQPSPRLSPEHDAYGNLLPIHLEDPNLERFPTDHEGILEHIRRTSKTLPMDETTSDLLSSKSTNSLPCVIEEDDDDDDDGQLEQLRNVEENEAICETETKDVGPDTVLPAGDPIIPPLAPQERESEVEELEKEENVEQDVEEVDAEEAEEQKELVELEQMAERSWVQKALDVAVHPVTWVAAIALAFALAKGISKVYASNTI